MSDTGEAGRRGQPGHTGEATVVIRSAGADDIAAITTIYRASVETTAASFEMVAPDEAEIGRRWRRVVAAGCPWLVAATVDAAVVGYAYARPFHERAAFAWTVENAVYVAPGAERQGLGRALLTELVDALAEAGFRQVVAVISSDAEAASVPLHAAAGFTVAGRLAAAGYKNGRWHDIVYMQRALGDGARSPPREQPARGP